MKATALTKAQKTELREMLGESIHTAFRKGSFHPAAGQVWKLIHEMPRDEWGNIVSFVSYCMGLDK